MVHHDLEQSTAEILAYLHEDRPGYPLLINTENMERFREITSRLEINPDVRTHRVSTGCRGDKLPDIDLLLDQLSRTGDNAIVGLSQLWMLQSFERLQDQLKKLLSMNIHGRLIVLLFRCEHLLLLLSKKDPRLDRHLLFVDGSPSELPHISLVGQGKAYSGVATCKGIQGLLSRLETISLDDLRKDSLITVETTVGINMFTHSMYRVEDGNDVFAQLRSQFPEMSGCERSYGTEEQWLFLYEQLKAGKSLAAVINKQISSADALPSKIGEVFAAGDSARLWLLWLWLKLHGANDEPYLQLTIQRSRSVSDFHESLMMALLDVSFEDTAFPAMYVSRKRILDALPENLPMLTQYCQRTGKYEKNAVYYLTDASEEEEHEFLRCLSIYDYSEKELLEITKRVFPELHKYLVPFHFTAANMLVPSSDTGLREEITQYFQAYKQQKLTNRIWPEHLERVLRYAEERPYNKMQARSTLAAKMNKRGVQLFFFDALGVEFLSYIVAKCEQYGLLAEIAVGVCQLPSITSENKDFISFFPGGAKKIDALDELKHHSQIYNYQQCKEPIHLFRELEIIDEQLRKIRSGFQSAYERAVIISDHGASRLAVISNRLDGSPIQLDEKAEHSGRCCKTEEDPHLPCAAYTSNGYVVLANYDRFKGGRPANVEVHGGATLEEVVVPLITITPRPNEIEIAFVEDVIQFKGKEPITLTVFANIVFIDPILVVDVNGTDHSYHGEFVGDQRHARFLLEDIKRSKKYRAAFFDGSKRLASDLAFTVQKGTKTNTAMGI